MHTWKMNSSPKGCYRGELIGLLALFVLSCTQTVTFYWSQAGAGPAELQHDKEECRELQRVAGAREEHIEKCLEGKGWSQVKREFN